MLGEGTARDDAAALGWFRAAADKGDGTGLLYAGLLVLQGRGTRADRDEGIRLLQRAARAPDPEIRAEAERWLAALPAGR